jgi:alkaline phosphatase D
MLWKAVPFDAQLRTSRRAFLATTTSLAAAALWSSRATGAVFRAVNLADYPFQLGVASGDPSPDGFVLWTRLAPRPVEGGGMPNEAVAVDWQVAEDEGMTKIVREGSTVATPDWAHSVHVEVSGLEPGRWYFYRFRAANELSPVGRTRTTPLLSADTDSLRFAFASCQHFEDGYYTAYEHMAREELDLIVHLGDYIYEGKARNDRTRKHVGTEIHALEDYRNRHALYKTDEFLQNAHRLFPWLVTWDDHEVDNNYANSISEEPKVQSDALLARRARAYQAYYEHMPLRRISIPNGPDMQLYRKVAFGRLAEFFVLDTRQYRTNQPCGDGNKAPCDEALDPAATLLGDRQEQWLLDGLSASSGRWNVLAQQVMMARVDLTPGDAITHSMDQWPGYEMNRRRILKGFVDRKVSNPVVLTGDIHSNWANNLIADFDDLDSRVVATEFVGTSISSGRDGMRVTKNSEAMQAENSFVKFHNAERGYVSCQVTPDRWHTDYRVVEYVTKPGAPLVTRASFVVENQRPGLQQA